MQRAFFHGVLLLVFSCSQLACTPQQPTKNLTIATAANMQVAMAAMVEHFSTQTGISCDLVISSSGKLTAQIKEGAPYDVFVSANMKYPEEIHRSGLSATTPKVYAYGKLVLWTLDEKIEPSIPILQEEAIQHIALANPKTAPYGTAAMEVLDLYQLSTLLSSKLVYGESIAQTNQFISSGAAEIGFTAKSVVLSPNIKGQGQWIELDASTYSPIEQGIVVIKQKDRDMEAALAFYHFIFSDEAQKILLNFGYSINE